MKDVAEFRLKAWKDLHELARPNWIYRGQVDASWDLSTSLERCFIRAGASLPAGGSLLLVARRPR